jgi:hypothetical protein
MSRSGLLDVDPAKQWDWHEAHRDMSRNQYRTSYTDMTHFKEVNVKSDYPSGYGGHIPSIRHDMLFRNTAFDRQQVLRRNDPSRDAHPSFKDHIAGIPTWCAKPQGAKKNPTYGVVPHDGTTTNIISPWAVVRPVRPVPSYRNVPTSLARTRSMPQIGGGRVNQAAMGVGAAVASPSGVSSGQYQDMLAQQEQEMLEQQAMLEQQQQGPSPGGASDRLKRSVSMANEQSNQQRMPSEQEMLMGEVFGQEQSEWD